MSNNEGRHASRQRGPPQQDRRRRHAAQNQQNYIPPVDIQAPLPIIQTSETGSASTFSTLTRSRQNRGNRRDHDIIGRRLEAALRELDEQTSALHSALQEPLPQIESNGVFLGMTADDSTAPRWPKRRKVDNDGLFVDIPKYEYEGRVVPGKLKMEIESCDSGAYRGGLPSPHHASQINEVLRDNSLVFSTESSRCNLVLKHMGDTAFTLTELVIKSPMKGYESRLQEGLIFVSMERQGLIYRTERYDMRLEESRPEESRQSRHHAEEEQRNRRSANRRHNSWQQTDPMPRDTNSESSATSQTQDRENEALPSSPQIPYSPTYLEFNVVSSDDPEVLKSRETSDGSSDPTDTQSRFEFVNALLDRTIMPLRLDDQRAEFSRRPNLQQVAARELLERGNGIPQASHTYMETDGDSSHLSSPSSSEADEDSEQQNVIRRNRQVLASQWRRHRTGDTTSSRVRNTGPFPTTFVLNSEGVPVIDHSRPDAALRQRWLGVWRHGARNKLLLEPRHVEWVPNKIKRDGMGEGPSGMPHQDPGHGQTQRQASQFSEMNDSPLQPHARFFIRKEKQGVSLRFEPPVAGRYILIKMFSPPGMNSINVQEIMAYGFAGPRHFPAFDFR